MNFIVFKSRNARAHMHPRFVRQTTYQSSTQGFTRVCWNLSDTGGGGNFFVVGGGVIEKTLLLVVVFVNIIWVGAQKITFFSMRFCNRESQQQKKQCQNKDEI